METARRNDVESLLSFSPDTAGGMMTTEVVIVGEDATRGEVVDHIRFHEIPPDQLDNIVLINREAKLAGTVPDRAPPARQLSDSACRNWCSSLCFR
jgi:magnesium transporter